MKIQIMSDLHLEFGTNFKFTPPADDTVLVLAGDILPWVEKPAYVKWVHSFNELYKAVIIIAGNHEFYGGGDVVYDPKDMLTTFAREFNNVWFLEKDFVIIDDVAFIGTCLWTDFNNQDMGVIFSAVAMMNDFATIRYDGEYFTNNHWYEENQASRAFISNALDATHGKKQVVVTHHLPSMMGIHPRFEGSNLNHAYANTGLDNLIFEKAPDLWIHGHSHETMDWVLGDVTRIVANPRGYEGYELNENFNPQFTVDI